MNDQPKPPSPPPGSANPQKRGSGLIGKSLRGGLRSEQTLVKPVAPATQPAKPANQPASEAQKAPWPRKPEALQDTPPAKANTSPPKPQPKAAAPQPQQKQAPVKAVQNNAPAPKAGNPAPKAQPKAAAPPQPQQNPAPAKAANPAPKPQPKAAAQNQAPAKPPQKAAPAQKQPAQQAAPAGSAAKPAAKAAPRPKSKNAPQAKPKPPTKPPQNKPDPKADTPKVIEVAPMAKPARAKPRHWGLVASFLIFVAFPSVISAFYLTFVAANQYESRVGFSVRAEESPSPIDLLGGIQGITSASSSDTDILYQFIQSQEMVQRVDERLNLREIYAKPFADPVFSLSGSSSIEELMDYWSGMVRLYYDAGTGLIEVRAYAFTAEDAQAISKVVFEESSQMINELSTIARADATRYAQEELNVSVERLIKARQALTAFRNRTQIVDPTADIAGQMGLLSTLQAQLAETMIEYDLLRETTRVNDPRLDQARRKIEVIEARIAEERQKLGVGIGDAGGYAEVIGEFEKLQVDRQFAEQAYVSARSAYDAAVAEAQRKSRYLAAYVQPTLAQTPTAPKRFILFLMVAGFTLMAWAIGSLIYYSLRDRR